MRKVIVRKVIVRKVVQAAVGVALVVLALGVGAPSSAEEDAGAGTTGSSATQTYIVRFRPDVDARAVVARRSARLGDVDAVLTNVFPGVITDLTAAEAARLADDPNVLDVEADTPIRATETQQRPIWGLDRIDQRQQPLDGTYSYPSAAGNGVDAYIIDSGVRGDHREFSGRMKAGHSEVDDGRGTTDCNGHGTHVAGTVAGTTYGVAKRASIIPVRVLDCNGDGWTSLTIAGMDWVVGRHTAGQRAVVNLSLGGAARSQVDAAVARMVADGIVVVAAAGNDDADACDYSPPRAPSAITVGATDPDDWRAYYSNHGRCLDIFAPGDHIQSAGISSSTATTTKSGTSMAAPHVAGVAAVLWSQESGLSSAAVATRVVAYSTTGLVEDPRTGSPNRLLHSPAPPIPRPANDDLAAATPIDVTGTGLSTGTTVGATVQAGEPAHSDRAATRTIWWTFTATETGSLPLIADSPSVAMSLAVYTGSSIGSLTSVAKSSRSGGSVTLAPPVVAGRTYRVVVDAWDDDAGPVTLSHGGLGTSSASPWWPLASPAAMVDRHFRDLVGRAPTSAELTLWATRLMNGTSTGSTLVTSLRASNDGTTIVDPTVRLYRAVLRRTPDQSGLTYWLAQRRTGGWSLNRTADFFVRSSEFVDRYGALSNRAFVTLIYTDILERPGDADGITYWTSELDKGRRSRGRVLLGFTESSEYRTAYAHHVDATVAYSSLLKRPPTAVELSTWVTRRDGGSTHPGLVREILHGEPYRARGV